MAKSYKTHVFRLRALTNLHAGAGDSFYGAVDKMVQRDAATQRPVIHSHSLKGALREYFEAELGLNQDFVNRVFGTPVKGTAAANARPGAYRFFSADLLAIPVPEQDPTKTKSYHLAADADTLDSYRKRLAQMGEKTWADAAALKAALQSGGEPIQDGPPFAQRFREAVEELPVVARNSLDNGKSENLWYEELVPRESIFVFVVQSGPTTDGSDEQTAADKKLFIEKMQIANQPIQIGANATVGYGYCALTLLNPATT